MVRLAFFALETAGKEAGPFLPKGKKILLVEPWNVPRNDLFDNKSLKNLWIKKIHPKSSHCFSCISQQKQGCASYRKKFHLLYCSHLAKSECKISYMSCTRGLTLVVKISLSVIGCRGAYGSYRIVTFTVIAYWNLVLDIWYLAFWQCGRHMVIWYSNAIWYLNVKVGVRI